jgi:hypothetical protein
MVHWRVATSRFLTNTQATIKFSAGIACTSMYSPVTSGRVFVRDSIVLASRAFDICFFAVCVCPGAFPVPLADGFKLPVTGGTGAGSWLTGCSAETRRGWPALA